jgi:hypothetical protein
MGLVSPWASSDDLSSIVWADLLDVDLLPITRAEAMAVPAMARARHLLVGAVATCPLVAYAGQDPLPDDQQPAWCYRTDGDVSPWHRMAWTVDDLLFSGWSLWAVDRGADGALLAADRVPRDRWSFGDGGTVLVDDRPAKRADVLLLPGPHEGVLTFAARTIRSASRMERAAARHASNPVPSVELRQTQDVPLSDAERDSLVASWVSARASDNGAVGFTSYGIEAHPLGQVPEQLLVEGRNAAAVDVARHVSMPAAMLDATSAGASLTYETTQGRSGQFLDYGVRLYVDAIAARLSMDDVLPRGKRIVLDTSALTALVPDQPNLLD